MNLNQESSITKIGCTKRKDLNDATKTDTMSSSSMRTGIETLPVSETKLFALVTAKVMSTPNLAFIQAEDCGAAIQDVGD